MGKKPYDSYKRRHVSKDVFQCGCHWVKDPDYGDVLRECSIHRQATKASVEKFERERIPNGKK